MKKKETKIKERKEGEKKKRFVEEDVRIREMEFVFENIHHLKNSGVFDIHTNL